MIPPSRLLISRLAAILLAAAPVGCDPGHETPVNEATGGGSTRDGEAGTADAAATALTPEQERDVVLLIRQERYGQARIRLRKHLDQHPDDGRAEFLFGLTYHRERRYGKALPRFERARRLAPRDEVIDYFLGWCLLNLGRLDEARTAFEAHLAQVPLEGDTHFALGLIALEEGRLDDAEASFRRAIELQSGRPGRDREVAKARGRLADVFMQRGDLEAARAELEASIALYGDHYEAYYKLARVLTRLGDEAGAAKAQQAFLAAQQRVPPGTRIQD